MSDGNVIEKILIATTISATISVGAYAVYKYKSCKDYKNIKKISDKEVNIKKENVKKILDKYFKEYLDEFTTEKLYTFYSWQLGVAEFKKEYIFNTIVMKSLIDLGFNMEESKMAEEVMNIKVKKIYKLYGINDCNLEEIDCKNFLQRYYELIGNRQALNKLKDKVEDVECWQKYYDDNEKRIKDLVSL